MKHTITTLCCLLVLAAVIRQATAKSVYRPAPRGSRVYVQATDSGERAHLTRAMDYWNYWTLVTDRDSADYVLKVKSKKGLNYRSYMILTSVANGKEVWRSDKVGTFWSMSFNPKKRAMRKLVRKRLKHEFQ